VASLAAVTGSLVAQSLAPKTLSAYRKAWVKFQDFAAALNKTALPADENLVALYIGHLVSTDPTPKPASVASTLSAVSYFHKLGSHLDPTASFLIRKALQGFRNSNPSTDARLPVTLPLLHAILSAIPKVCLAPFEVALFRAMFALMFHAFLRISEVTDSPHNLPFHNVNIASLVSVMFDSYKHCKTSPFTLYIPCAPSWCPVALMTSYVKLRGERAGPFFCDASGAPIQQTRVRSFLSLVLASLPGNHKFITPHSFRIGAATFAATQGYTSTQIQAMGRWNSNAVDKYIRIHSFEVKT
jgi:site-specific recombinase XerD